MPGAAFPDGKPRLVIGTGSGRLLVVVRDHRGLIVAERIHTIAGGVPINDVGPLPQAGGVLLGVAAGAHLYGLQDVSSLAQERFRLMHPGGLPVRSFRSFEPDTMALEASDPYAHIAFCDGLTERLYFARVPASAAGSGMLDTVTNTTVYSDMGADASTITGSLLILTAGRRDVYYRPGYATGTSVPGCRVNLAEEMPEVCLSCPIEQNGDVNQSLTLNSSDVIQLVNTVFKGGAWPEPCMAAGDVNCTGQVNSSDIIYLINFVFRGADPPCNVCALFAGTWDCP